MHYCLLLVLIIESRVWIMNMSPLTNISLISTETQTTPVVGKDSYSGNLIASIHGLITNLSKIFPVSFHSHVDYIL